MVLAAGHASTVLVGLLVFSTGIAAGNGPALLRDRAQVERAQGVSADESAREWAGASELEWAEYGADTGRAHR